MRPLLLIKRYCVGSNLTVLSISRLYQPCNNLKWLAVSAPCHLRCTWEKARTTHGFAKCNTTTHTGRGLWQTIWSSNRLVNRDEKSSTVGSMHQRPRIWPQFEIASTKIPSLPPSKELVNALRAIGCEHAVPAVIPNKPDLSFIPANPAKLRPRRRTRRLIKGGCAKIWLTPTKLTDGRFVNRWQLMKKDSMRGRPLIHHVKPTFIRKDGYTPQHLQSILAQYLRRIHKYQDTHDMLSDNPSESRQEMDMSILHVFNEDAMALLQSKGYDAGDVVSWAAILTAESSEKAALLLTALSVGDDRHVPSAEKCIPTFVFLFLLRRQHITAPALRFLIIHAWNRLENRVSSDWVSTIRHHMGTEPGASIPFGQDLKRIRDITGQYLPMSESTIVVMIIRLLRHARDLWPASLPAVSAMLTVHVTGGTQASPDSSEMAVKTSSRLSFLYNRILRLLALPSSQHPYRDVPFHQRAQFSIIRRMNRFEPALTINREGYRAVARVQLAHRKTLQERTWAAMKAKSWPPWKEDKLGIDADIGVEAGISRANQALIRSNEAGYAPRDWEISAKILSGWDTDRSPTIQTRAISQDFTTSSRTRHLSSPAISTTPPTATWSARIRSTRTVEEAWACFLNYKESKASPELVVYRRMLEKIVFSRTRPREGSQAGDGREVAAPPPDPRDRIYVRTAPPSMNAFFDAMIADGVYPSGRCLEILLNRALTLRDGVRYLRSSYIPQETLKILLHQRTPNTEDAIRLLKLLSPSLFAAFIQFLCRFAATNRKFGKFGKISKFAIHPLLHAFRLVYARKPAQRTPWHSLLSAVMNSRLGVTNSSIEDQVHVQDVAAWKSMMAILDQMGKLKFGLDFEGFRMLCIGLERAILSSQHILQDLRQPLSHDEVGLSGLFLGNELAKWENRRFNAKAVIRNGPMELKALFKRFVTGHLNDGLKNGYKLHSVTALVLRNGSDSKVLLPRLLVVPAPAELHAFIRVLGVSHDYEGILELVYWMVRFAMELKAAAVELKNGAAFMRRCLIAIRVFLEGHSQSVASIEEGSSGDERGMVDRASDSIIEQAFTQIQGVEDWGGWPTDQEVEEYLSKGTKTRDK